MTPSAAGFSFVAGGPAHWLQAKLGLVGPESLHLARRALLSTVFTWVVLLVLSAAQGLAIGGGVKIPFLYDFAAYARFLVAIPMLIVAEGLIGREIAAVAAHFLPVGARLGVGSPEIRGGVGAGEEDARLGGRGGGDARPGGPERAPRARRVPLRLLDLAIARFGRGPPRRARSPGGGTWSSASGCFSFSCGAGCGGS